MKQVASVIRDGTLRYYLADPEQGELTEFAQVMVPEAFGAEDAVKLGFNLIGALGLNGSSNGHRARHIITPEQAGQAGRALDVGQTWAGAASLVDYITAHPGCRVADIADHFQTSPKAVHSAVTRAAAAREINRRQGRLYVTGASSTRAPADGRPRGRAEGNKLWDITREQVVDYIRAHPDCRIPDIAEALLGSSTKETRQVIGNRLASIADSVRRQGRGPRIVKRYEDAPAGGAKIVFLRIEEDAHVLPSDAWQPSLE